MRSKIVITWNDGESKSYTCKSWGWNSGRLFELHTVAGYTIYIPTYNVREISVKGEN